MPNTDLAKVIRFPIERRLSADNARLRIGSVNNFRGPDALSIEEALEWAERFLIGKNVLLGWTAINHELVQAFKRGAVRHIVSSVESFNGYGKPRITLCCQDIEEKHIYNWKGTMESVPPVVLLTLPQSQYFRPCQKCEEMKRIMRW